MYRKDVQDWPQGMTSAELHKYQDAVRLCITSMPKYLWFVSSRYASLYTGRYLNSYG